jgi:hypothetical protein
LHGPAVCGIGFRRSLRGPQSSGRNEIYSASERMRAEGKDEDLVASFRLLADTRVFDAACLALQKYDKTVT